MDMPLSFDIFLPMRLPFSLTTSFNEPERSVQLGKSNFSHPFFFGNTVNAKCMNMRLQWDLQRAVANMCCIEGYWGSIYDIRYTALCYNRKPFSHQIIARERGPAERCIRFDFIIALEFDGAEMPLPAYYNVPIGYKWLAYGQLPIDAAHNAADWAVLVPRWQSADWTVRLRSHNMLLLLYRLLYSQGCYCFAVPFLVKFGFFMTTVACGEDYKRISVAGLMITVRICSQLVHLSLRPLLLYCSLSRHLGIRYSATFASSSSCPTRRIRRQISRALWICVSSRCAPRDSLPC